MICFNCKGNGFLKLSWEGEQSIEQCKVCNSSGETKESLYYNQHWDDGTGSPTIYYGPPLDVEGDEGFKNYKIYPIEPNIDSS